MPAVIQFKPIGPPTIKVDGVRLELLNLLRKRNRQVQEMYKRTTRTWRQHHPEFQAKISLAGGDAKAQVWTEDRIYLFIDQGTRIRWAVMSGDWQSKTRPRFLGSGPGRGRAVLVGKRAMTRRGIAARPGIQAREFSIMISEEVAKTWNSEVQKAIERGTARDWGKKK